MGKNLSIMIKKYWLLIFFVIIFLFMAIFKISPRDIWMAVSVLKAWQLFLLLFSYFLISLFLIIARKYLLSTLASPVKVKNLIFIHFSTIAAHYATPAKIGFPLAVYLLNQYENVPYATGTTMILIELIISTAVCGVIAFVGSFHYFGGRTDLFLLSFLYLTIMAFLTFYGMRFFLKRGKANSRAHQFIKNVVEAFSQFTLYRFLGYTLIIIFIQFLGGLVLVLLSHFLSTELSLWQATIANSAAFFLGALSMIPMGLGVREGSMLFYLRHLGIPNEIGISIVTIQRMFSTGLSFVLGVIFGTILGVRNLNQDSI